MKFFILTKDNYNLINDDNKSSLIQVRKLLENSIITTVLCAYQSNYIVALYLSDDPDYSNLVTELDSIYDDIKEVTPPNDLNTLEPINIDGTTFQHQVWEGIMKIPYGEKWSYKRLAKEIGNPKAIRAVASACGKNEVSILIPCHRVVPSTGSGNGKYRWGSKLKSDIIKHEGVTKKS